MRQITKVCLVIISTLLIAASAAAQSAATAELHVSVKDPKGLVVRNATVTAANAARNIQRTAVQNSEGDYQFLLLPPGQYTVSVQAPGFAKTIATNVTVTVGQRAELPVALQLAAVESVVSVTGELELIETQRTAVADTIDQARPVYTAAARHTLAVFRLHWILRLRMPGRSAASKLPLLARRNLTSGYVAWEASALSGPSEVQVKGDEVLGRFLLATFFTLDWQQQPVELSRFGGETLSYPPQMFNIRYANSENSTTIYAQLILAASNKVPVCWIMKQQLFCSAFTYGPDVLPHTETELQVDFQTGRMLSCRADVYLDSAMPSSPSGWKEQVRRALRPGGKPHRR